jgi:hypothetical protein
MPPAKPIYGSTIASQPPTKNLEVQTQPWLEERSLSTTPFYLFLCEKLHDRIMTLNHWERECFSLSWIQITIHRVL